MKISVDSDRCSGHGVCVAECPELFRLTDDGWAEVLIDDVPPHLQAAAHTAVSHCPERAISVD